MSSPALNENEPQKKDDKDESDNPGDLNVDSTENEEEVADDFSESVPQMLPLVKYEFLDHPADVQIHAWGDNLQEAFEQCAMGMFAYMTDINTVDNLGSVEVEAEGTDLNSLLFRFLDEFLYTFCVEPFFISRKIEITQFDATNFKIKAVGYGEPFDLSKHPQGTEVKAITYSNMQVHESESNSSAEVFVIIDI